MNFFHLIFRCVNIFLYSNKFSSGSSLNYMWIRCWHKCGSRFINFPLCSVAFVLFRGKNEHNPSLLLTVWKVGGSFDCNRGVRGWNNSSNNKKDAVYIFPLLIFASSYFPADVPLNMHNHPSKTTQVRMNLPHFMTFSGLHVFSSAVVIAQCPSN